MPIRLVESSAAEALGLPAIDPEAHRRLISSRAAQRNLGATERDQQHRRRTTTTPRLPRGLQCTDRRFDRGLDHGYFKGVVTLAQTEALGSSPDCRGSVKGRAARSARKASAVGKAIPSSKSAASTQEIITSGLSRKSPSHLITMRGVRRWRPRRSSQEPRRSSRQPFVAVAGSSVRGAAVTPWCGFRSTGRVINDEQWRPGA